MQSRPILIRNIKLLISRQSPRAFPLTCCLKVEILAKDFELNESEKHDLENYFKFYGTMKYSEYVNSNDAYFVFDE